MSNDAWKTLVHSASYVLLYCTSPPACHHLSYCFNMLRRAKVDMCVKSWVDVSKPVTGNGYCAAVVEVEVDVLTGETQVLQADILYDAGKSLSPLIDIGCVGLVHIVRAERQALKARGGPLHLYR